MPACNFVVTVLLTAVTCSEYREERAFLGPVGIFEGLSASLLALLGVEVIMLFGVPPPP